MMSSYFSLPSFARAKKNKEELEKSNPSEPVLKDDDEKFLRSIATEKQDSQQVGDVTPVTLADDGQMKPAKQEDVEKAGTQNSQVVLPDIKSTENQDSKAQHQLAGEADDASRVAKQADEGAKLPISTAQDTADESEVPTVPPAKEKEKAKGIELPSQEEAERATSFMPQEPEAAASSSEQEKSPQEDKKSWSSYIQSFAQRPKSGETNEETSAESQVSGEKKTWTQYASQYVPSASALPAMPDMSMPSLPSSWSRSKDKDAHLSPVYNEDGTIDEEATKSKQEAEVSVLLDNMNASTVNNRVFSLSGPMQEYYSRFTQCLKDTLNGAPTAYEDMDKLMREAGPQLQKQFDSMPPFVQMLVKSLPAKLGSTLGPELLAASSEKPGADASAQLAAASKTGGSLSPRLEALNKQSQKQKKKTPGLKKLVSEKGTVATALRSVVTFVQTRFPFLASATNVLMSLAVFILMLVFWYCHKRGKEVRLAREQEGASAAAVDGSESPDEYDATDDEMAASVLSEKSPKDAEKAQEEQKQVSEENEQSTQDQEANATAKQDMLDKADPPDIPLPADEQETADEVKKG